MSITFTTTGGPELNLASGNAARLLELLGLTEPWGECEAEDFLGCVLTARGLLDVATDDEQGRPTVTDDGRWTWCGTPPGYLAGRLAELQDIATWAHQHHGPVFWG
ncbi:hypothetical protein [Sphaerisporangium album]|uniref:hypothetical protein n=1 Tax=Sphaerisporangium album TaxID=509200 RepID=UPI0015F0FBD5|nr:hypothetical protein [Sphaerisporangium album]